MRGRTLFSDPLAPFGIVAMVAGLMLPAGLELTKKLKVVQNDSSKVESSQTATVAQRQSIEWTAAKRTLDEYRTEAPNRPIVAVFYSKWEPFGQTFMKHIEANRANLFASESPLFLKYDCSGPGIGWNERDNRRINYLPYSLVTYGGNWEHTGSPNDYLKDPYHPDDYLKEFRRILSAARLDSPPYKK